MKTTQQKLLWALAIGFGLVLLSNPKCNRGCKMLAERLIAHGAEVLL